MAELNLLTIRREDAFRQRFWSKVDFHGPNGCWLWLGSISKTGYGLASLGSRTQKAHRVAWVISKGPILAGDGHHGICVLHRCDVRACVNPAHLFLGTVTDNNLDRDQKGRTSSLKGHPAISKFSESDVRQIRQSKESQYLLADQFGVSQSAISAVKTRRNWAWVQ